MAKQFSWQERSRMFDDLVDGVSADRIASSGTFSSGTVKRWAKLVGMSFAAARTGGGVIPMPMDALPNVTPDRGYRRLTLEDRTYIQVALETTPPLSLRKIAARLGVAVSTVSREVSRNRIEDVRSRYNMVGDYHYHARVAHYRTLRDRPRFRPGKLSKPKLREAVVSRLNDKLSPEQVSAELRGEYPNDPEMHVSHETIYQALYVQGYGALRHELSVEKALRSGRTTRKPRSKLPPRSQRPWLEGATITDRPPEASDRSVPGNWEGDLVVGPMNSGIVTLVERRSRYTLLGRLPGARDSETVTAVLLGMIRRLPDALFSTITWDQGSEMAGHARFSIEAECPVFFCDPHSPWQRPTNENTNGLIRDFFPKQTNFNTVTDEELLEAERLLNRRPRKVLGWRKPREVLLENITGVALTP